MVGVGNSKADVTFSTVVEVTTGTALKVPITDVTSSNNLLPEDDGDEAAIVNPAALNNAA